MTSDNDDPVTVIPRSCPAAAASNSQPRALHPSHVLHDEPQLGVGGISQLVERLEQRLVV
jgi:hypothetical protein